MKRILRNAMTVLMLAAVFCVPVSASSDINRLYSEANPEGVYIVDEAGILDSGELEELNRRAQALSESYGCGIYVITVYDYNDYGGGDVQICAESLYLQYDLGWGSGRDGKLLLLSMDERDYASIAYGDFANAAFTDYASEKLDEAFLDDFAEDEWAAGFSDYLEECERILHMAEEGTPLEYDTDPGNQKSVPFVAVTSVLIAAVITGMIAIVQWAALKRRVRTATSARQYAVDSRITHREDRYLHTTESRVKIESDSGKSGGTHVNSSGFSGHKGKF